MRIAADSSENGRDLTEIGEILSKGVELLIRARQQNLIKQPGVTASHFQDEDADPLLKAASDFGAITTGEAIQITGMSRSTARRKLAELVQKGELRLSGEGRGAKYTLASKTPKTENH